MWRNSKFEGKITKILSGNLTAAVLNGTVPQWRVDDMVIRIMAAYYKVGRDQTRVPVNFDSWTLSTTGPLHFLVDEDIQQINWHVNVQGDHASLIREIGGRSVVMLKNDNNALPLRRPRSVAVIGQDAHPNPAGPNACSDRGCQTDPTEEDWTLAMGWGSGTDNFPYLVAPVDALRVQAQTDRSTFANVSNNYDYAAIDAAVSGADVALVFASSDSGEGYITVDGNEGDRNNLTLWGSGDALIAEVAAHNPNTIVVLHTVGPVIVEALKNNPNVTAILWAGIPGQESGNAIVDVLYGSVNPSAKSVFTWGKQRSDWGTDILYDSDAAVPQINFTEGVFIDYRHFDAAGIEPSYEFGFGLSYTTFSYSNLRVEKRNPGPYVPTTGTTRPAPTYGKIDTSIADNSFPAGFQPVKDYIYPYLDQYDFLNITAELPPGSQDGAPQPKLAAGGAAGGNSGLYDIMYEVSCTIRNTGKVDGIEVPQLVSILV